MAPFGASRAGLMSVAVDDIPDSAVYRWPVDEGSGQTLTDELQNEDITTNFENWVSGSQYVGENAKSFDGVDDEGSTSDSLPEITVSEDFSIEIWADLGSVSSGEVFLYHHPSDEDRVGFGIDQDDGSKVAFGVFDGTTRELQADIPSGLAQFVLTWDSGNSNISAFVNSTETTDGGNLNFTSETKNELSVGHRENRQHTEVVVDLIQPHGETLSQSQVDDLYNDHPST